MNLKKNDKLILIVGVVILIIAAIGVAVYTSPDTEDIKAGDTEPEFKTYHYSWIKRTGETIIGENLYSDKNSPYSDLFTITTPTGSILTKVEIQINWKDDSTYGILIKRGEDTLTADINQQGNEPMTKSSKGSGNLTFPFNLNDIPSSDSVLAEDKLDAENIINGIFSGENVASFNVEVSIETGERIWRLFKFIRDQGNEFELVTINTYYEYEIEEPGENDEDKTTSDDSEYITQLGEYYKNLCYGRGMI